jgi:tetratricopeptide (TPR) repeat protein
MKHAIWWQTLLILALSMLTGLVRAEDHTQAFIDAQALFERGLRGSEKDNEAASERFKTLTEQEPGNPLFLAYYGSTFTLMARDALMPWKKMRLGEQGLELIDKALRQLTPEHDQQMFRSVPVSIETRMVAINTFLKVPDMFYHRFEAGRALLAKTMASPVFASAGAPIQARYHFQAAAIAEAQKKKDEERDHLKRVLELDPASADAPAARARLKEVAA